MYVASHGSTSRRALAKHMLKLSTPCTVTAVAISACGNSWQWVRALELLSEMQLRGIPPSLVAYSAAIEACVRCMVDALAAQVRAVTWRLPGGQSRGQPP